MAYIHGVETVKLRQQFDIIKLIARGSLRSSDSMPPLLKGVRPRERRYVDTNRRMVLLINVEYNTNCEKRAALVKLFVPKIVNDAANHLPAARYMAITTITQNRSR